jgi:tetratricopeptide (TPR) repeat protein
MSSNGLPDQDVTLAEEKEPGRKGFLSGAARRSAAWIKAHRLLAGLAIGGVILLSTAAVAIWAFISVKESPSSKTLVTLSQVFEALDRRSYAETQILVHRLQEQGTLPIEELGGPAFALGAVAAYEAEDTQGKKRTTLYLLAARYLEEASRRGFPAGRQGQGFYLLGKSLYETGQLPASRAVLRSALKTSPQYSAEIHALLANTYLNDPSPKFQQALEQNSSYLAEKLSAEGRWEGLLQRAQILLQLRRIDQCNAALDEIPPESKNYFAAMVVRGQVLMYEAQTLSKQTPESEENRLKARAKLEGALKTLDLVLGKETTADPAVGRAMYLAGMCFLELKDYKAAAEQFFRAQNLYPETLEGTAAAFRLAEVYRLLGRNVEALGEYRHALGEIITPENYHNPWIPLEQLKSGYLAAYHYYLDARNFEIALQLARIMHTLFPPDQVLLLQAEAHGVWGQTLINQAEKAPRKKAELLRSMGREQFRRAGVYYAKLVKLLPANRTYTDQVWNCAMAMMQGRDYRDAARMFQIYLKNEIQRRRAQALTDLGESLLALGELDKALEMFKECMELHPRDIAACRARLLAARAYQEKDDYRKAEILLRENLNGENLTPASQEWRDSLFFLGELLHAEGRYAEAVPRLAEAVNRYGDLPEASQARYLLGNCYREMAIAAQGKHGRKPTDDTRTAETKHINELFSQAVKQYRQVLETLADAEENDDLNPAQKSILRNCYFAVGEVLFAQGNYEAAAKAYATAANRYQGRPEVLNAYVQMANAYRRLNKPREAQNALRQAMFALSRMKSDAAFEEVSNFNRKQWAQRLDRLSNL